MTVRTSTAIIGTLTAAMVLVPFTVLPVARASAIDWTQLGSTIDGTGVGDHAGSAVALSGDGTVLAIGAPDFTGSVGTARGLVRVYEWNGSAWMQRGADLEGAENNSDWGASVALSYDGSVLAIGAPNANSSLGEVMIRVWNASRSRWDYRGSAFTGFNANDRAGTSVALSSDGNTLAFGLPNYSTSGMNFRGMVRMFTYDPSTYNWSQRGSNLYGAAANERLGTSLDVSADGTVLAMGAVGASKIRVFAWQSGSWWQRGSDMYTTSGWNFGFSVSLSDDGSTVAGGAPYADDPTYNQGSALVYAWDSSTSRWTQRGGNILGDAVSDQLGYSVALSGDGDTLAVGANQHDGNVANDGLVRVFGWDGAAWVQDGSDIDGGDASEYSGHSVSLSSLGDRVAIGGPYTPTSTTSPPGRARVFARSAAGLTPTFGSVTRTNDGFTVSVTNYDADYSWSATATGGAAASIDTSGVVTVSGLSAGVSSTVTVSTSRTGYSGGSASETGQTKSTQPVTWAPVTAISTASSTVTPSALASVPSGGGSISYSVVSHSTTSCSVDSSTAVLTVAGTGECVVRATAAASADYLEGTTDVTFSLSKAPQPVTWSPTTALTLPGATISPSAASAPPDGGSVTYSVEDAGTTGCSVNSSTGALTYTGAGSCVVRASAAATSAYVEGFTDVTFSISKATPTLAWSPVLVQVLPNTSTTFAAATSSSGGSLTYAVTNAGTTGCSLPSASSQVLSFTNDGSCEVTATVAATSDYDEVTSVKTFAIYKSAQTVSWSPSTSLDLSSLSANLDSASTSGDGALSYSVTSAGGTGCSFGDSSSPVLTYSAPGTCTVTATAADTTNYAQATTSASIRITAATPTITWSPDTSLTLPGATVAPTTASSDGDGTISYAVTSDTGTGCTVNSSTGAVTYTSTGQCSITATSAPTTRYRSASASATFAVSLAPQTITGAASSTSLAPRGSATLSDSGSTGSGAVTWTRTSGAGVCTLSGTTVTAVSDGTCVLTVEIAADATYAAASDTVTITVNSPPPPSSGGGVGSSSGTSSNGASESTPASGGTSSGSPSPSSGSSPAITSDDSVNVPGAQSGVGRRLLPPPPQKVKVTPLKGKTRAKVLVGLPTGSAGATVLSTMVVVRDAEGKVVSRIQLPVKAGQQQTEVIVPFVADGYSVNVYNVNEVGVSTGALDSSPLVRATTIIRRKPTGTPTLFGAPLGKPILFNAGGSWLDPNDKRQLNAIARKAKASTERLFITGFARKGVTGSRTELASLSTARAKAVASYLAKRGVRVWIRYWGAGALNGTGKATDRRVEIRTSPKPIPRSLVP